MTFDSEHMQTRFLGKVLYTGHTCEGFIKIPTLDYETQLKRSTVQNKINGKDVNVVILNLLCICRSQN